MMGGAFQTSREIFGNPIWQNIVEFRLFFLIYGMATFIDGVKTGGIELKRGQWVRSIRNLQSDLEYKENRSIKKYSTSTIDRAIKSLIKSERIKIETTELGTLFEVVNYAKYQEFDNYKNCIENTERTVGEQQENNGETVAKRKRNNNKNVNNANNVKELKEVINTYSNDPKLNEALMNFLDMRIKKKKEPTVNAMELVIKKIKPFDIETQIQMVENSIVGGWTDVYKLKEEKQPTNQKSKQEKISFMDLI